jgi:hypothetical protein
MNVILRHRKSGRTQSLIELCAEAEGRGEVSYIVCSSHVEAHRIAETAKEFNLNIGFPITYHEFLKGEYFGRNIKNFFIDNADHLLQSITTVPIKAVTMEKSETW